MKRTLCPKAPLLYTNAIAIGNCHSNPLTLKERKEKETEQKDREKEESNQVKRTVCPKATLL